MPLRWLPTGTTLRTKVGLLAYVMAYAHGYLHP